MNFINIILKLSSFCRSYSAIIRYHKNIRYEKAQCRVLYREIVHLTTRKFSLVYFMSVLCRASEIFLCEDMFIRNYHFVLVFTTDKVIEA